MGAGLMAARGLTYEQLVASVQGGDFAPLYFLYGEETFLVEEIQRLIIDRALEPHERDFNLDIVYGSDADVRHVLSLCSGYPVMAQRRVVVVREFERLEDNRLFTSYAESPNPTAVVVLACNGKPNLNTHPYRALRQHAAVEFKALRDREMPGWVQTRAKMMGRNLEPEALHAFVEFLGTDLRAAVTELEKLITFVGERNTITVDDVVRASGQTREISVFELQKAVGSGRHNDAVRIGERLLQHASNPYGETLMIVSILASFYTKVWKLGPLVAQRLPDAQIAREIGVPPYFLSEYKSVLGRIGGAGIQQAFVTLLAADFELKGGSTRDPQSILYLTLSRLTAARR